LSKSEQFKASLNQGLEMRMAISYGLERFWSEHLQLHKKAETKFLYWTVTWDALIRIMEQTGFVNLLDQPYRDSYYRDNYLLQKSQFVDNPL
jgi:hypothetical protein